MVSWWWLSFASETDCLGVVIIQAPTFLLAAATAGLWRINPGGECVGFPVPEDLDKLIPATHRNRLLTKAEAQELDALVEKKIGKS